LVICFSWNNKNYHGFIGDRARKFMVEESAIDSEKEYYSMDLKWKNKNNKAPYMGSTSFIIKIYNYHYYSI